MTAGASGLGSATHLTFNLPPLLLVVLYCLADILHTVNNPLHHLRSQSKGTLNGTWEFATHEMGRHSRQLKFRTSTSLLQRLEETSGTLSKHQWRKTSLCVQKTAIPILWQSLSQITASSLEACSSCPAGPDLTLAWLSQSWSATQLAPCQNCTQL